MYLIIILEIATKHEQNVQRTRRAACELKTETVGRTDETRSATALARGYQRGARNHRWRSVYLFILSTLPLPNTH